jgi:hypothetical protein
VKLTSARDDDGFVELLIPGEGANTAVRAGIEFRSGRAVAAVSFGPLIHPVWQRLDASALVLKGGRLSGKLSWIPRGARDGDAAFATGALELKVDLRSGFAKIARDGTEAVALLGELTALPERAAIELAFDAPLVGGERWRRRVVVRLESSGSKVEAKEFLNGRAYSDWSAVVDGVALNRREGRLAATIEATIASATVQSGFYVITLKGEVVGPWIVGTFESNLAGAGVAKGDFTGWFEPAGG